MKRTGSFIRPRRIVFAAFLALAAFGCRAAGTGPADPVASDAQVPMLAVSGGQTEAALNKQLEAEKARIKLAQEQSKAEYDRLKIEWDRFLRLNPKQTRLLTCDPLAYAADAKIIGPRAATYPSGPTSSGSPGVRWPSGPSSRASNRCR